VLLEETISEKFAAICRKVPGRTAVKTPSSQLLYLELDLESDALALGLLELGIRNGDRVAISLGNCVPYAVVSVGQRHLVIAVRLILCADIVCMLQDRSSRGTVESSLHG